MDTTNYGSVITEQGDLGFGVTPIINEQTKNDQDKGDKDKDNK